MNYQSFALNLDNYLQELELYYNYREDTKEFQVFSPELKKAVIRLNLSEYQESAIKEELFLQTLLDIKAALRVFDS